MNHESDTRVFLYCDAPVLMSYHRIHRKYLLLIYFEGIAKWGLVHFHEILDLVPVDSIKVDAFITVLETIEQTLWLWRLSVLEALQKEL